MTTQFWSHVQILKVNAIRPKPGGKVEEPQSEAAQTVVSRLVFHYVGENRGMRPKESRVKLIFGGLRLIKGVFVFSEVTNHLHYFGNVIGPCGSNL